MLQPFVISFICSEDVMSCGFGYYCNEDGTLHYMLHYFDMIHLFLDLVYRYHKESLMQKFDELK